MKHEHLPEGWRVAKLSELLKQRKARIMIDDEQQYKRCTVKLHNAGIVPRDVIYGRDISTKSQQLTRENDLLVAEIDAKVGGFGIVKADTAGAIVSSHYYLFEVNNGLDLDYLEQFIIAGGLERQVYALGTTNYAVIRADDVLT
jgi:type I restriction enzyme S subunit